MLSPSSVLGLLFARPYEWICTIAVILFTIFVVLKLDDVCYSLFRFLSYPFLIS